MSNSESIVKNTEAPEQHDQSDKAQKSLQKKLLLRLTVVFLITAIAYLIYWFIYSRHFQSTDNAYVAGNVVSVTSQITGTIIAVNVDDTAYVKVGTELIKLDPTDSLVALEQAKADLALIWRQTQQLYIKSRALQADIQAKQSNLNEATQDLKRRKQAIRLGGISKEELNHAQDLFNSANSALINAQAAWQANEALINKTKLIQHPNVVAAIARLKQAYINSMRNTIYAPVTGYVSKRSAQVGQRVNPGNVLMAVVPLNDVWVDANFKEKQLRKMEIGQSAELTADIYGSKVVYHGQVFGFSGGTGSAFSLLPAQNATGNWIKIVQRLPVRIVLEPQELQKHPLRIGLSMDVTVDTASNPHSVRTQHESSNKTTIFSDQEKQADVLVAQFVANQGSME